VDLSRYQVPVRRLLLGLTLLGLLPLAVMTGVSIHDAHEQVRRLAERESLDLARAVSSAVEAELLASVWPLQALSASDAVQRGNIRDIHAELSRFASARTDVVAISLADDQGRVLLRTSEPLGTTSPRALEPSTLSRTVSSTKPQIGPLVNGPTGEPVYAVRVPVMVSGSVKYVLTAGVRPDRMRAILERQQRPSAWAVAVFDSQGRRVARSTEPSAAAAGAPFAVSPAFLATNESDEGVGATTGADGEEFVTAFARIPIAQWVVAISSPAREVDLLSRTTLNRYVLGVGASVLMSLILAMLLARRIDSDIRHVVRQANNIGGDRHEAPFAPHTLEMADLLQHVTVADRRVRAALDAAASAGAAKDRFLAVLSHELRNPLAPISNVLSLLDMKGDQRTARERLILRRQVRHMTRLVDDLLDVSRLVEGKLSLQLELVDLGQLVTEVGESFRQEQAEIPLEIQVSTTPCTVAGDAVRLSQVVNNLLVNALRHSAGKPITVSIERSESHARMSVTDRGDGMSSETRSKLFEPFFQARTNAGSLGLGLAIVKGIVDQHGGSIQVFSDGPGLGSSFVIRLPLAQDPAHQDRLAAPGRPKALAPVPTA